MTELRTAPAKPDPRFWDLEAHKLMLIKYEKFKLYATKFSSGMPHNYGTSLGNYGLYMLGFCAKSLQESIPAYVRPWRLRLVKACGRVYKQMQEGITDHERPPLRHGD